MSDIDFVVTWVDCNDVKWQEQYANYKGTKLKLEGEEGARYRENNMFKYWFRAVEKYAPWVRKIHLITADQKPEWLNVNHEKLNLVSHKDFIPEQYLPTFSANPIELNIHRIQGLSEKFVLFNDDFLLNSFIDPDFYFKNGLPCDSFLLKPIAPWNIDSTQFISMIVMNTIVINRNFSLREFVKKHPGKIYSLKYSTKMIKNYFYYKYNKFYIGFENPHLPQPFLKKTFLEVWGKEYELLDSTSHNKFRKNSDLTQYVFRYWHLASADFTPVKPKSLGKYCNICMNSVNDIIEMLDDESCKQICLNDSTTFDSFEALDIILDKLENKFPEKSSFEI